MTQKYIHGDKVLVPLATRNRPNLAPTAGRILLRSVGWLKEKSAYDGTAIEWKSINRVPERDATGRYMVKCVDGGLVVMAHEDELQPA